MMLCGNYALSHAVVYDRRCRNQQLNVLSQSSFTIMFDPNCGIFWQATALLGPLRFTKCFFEFQISMFLKSFQKLWVRNLPVELFAQVVHLCQRLHHLHNELKEKSLITIHGKMSFCHLSFLLELEVFPVEPERGDSILGGVMSDSLDPRVQEVPGQEL